MARTLALRAPVELNTAPQTTGYRPQAHEKASARMF
jgi:hypothetical protein